ncbi:hypothetical protein [Lacinutrix sp. MEBiC02404]
MKLIFIENIKMQSRTKISSNIAFKKYFLSWFVLVLAYFITAYFHLNRFWDYATWSIAILAFILFISLKKLEFTETALYFGNKKIEFEAITALRTFEIQQRTFYLFKTDDKHIFKRYYLTQLGGLGYFSIIKILFSKKSKSTVPLVAFLALLDEKSNISKS